MNINQSNSEQQRFEIRDRAMSFAIGIGYLALVAVGVCAVTNGDLIGFVPAAAGAGMAASQFYEAAKSSSNINEFRTNNTDI